MDPTKSKEERMKDIMDSITLKVEEPIVIHDSDQDQAEGDIQGSGIKKSNPNKARMPKGSEEAKKRMAYVRSFRKKKL